MTVSSADEGIFTLTGMDQIHDVGLQELYQYWDDHKAGNSFPNPDCIDLLDFVEQARWWCLADVKKDDENLFIRYYGTELAEFSGVDRSG